jgi:glutamine synthetase
MEESIMSRASLRDSAKATIAKREHRKIKTPTDNTGRPLSVTDYFGMNVFNVFKAQGVPEKVKEEIKTVSSEGGILSKESQEIIANAVKEWAVSKGATHFTHWFQPLTGSTAEKHDAFLDFNYKTGEPIEKLGAAQLLQGEPDASSFPNGGSRSTFEARGYTSWDFTSPLFITEATNAKTLCIPTAFVSYDGQALDVKTPLLRSIVTLNKEATKFMNLIGAEDVKEVKATCGCEQEYFLVDEALYQQRPDLLMCGRTLLGSASQRDQQLSDHYFGSIHDRVLAFMGELDYELYKLGIPAKTRHNEVAPGQFEIAPIFEDANVAADHNQLLMKVISKVANRHNFEALLHEKPFADINGSGKHLNWSMATDTGINLLDPGDKPEENLRFLAITSAVVAAVKRHAEILRVGIASAGNDHRLGGHEAPPSIISVFVGDTLDKIFRAIIEDKEFIGSHDKLMEMGTTQLAHLFKDNTDRNRTSPFAFTGNKFEFRAVGSNKAVGLPLTFLNAAVANVMKDANAIIEREIGAGKTADEALAVMTKTFLTESEAVIFNGDGYSSDWVKEAEKRGLPNLRNTAEALASLRNEELTKFLVDTEVLSAGEVETRYNVLVEQYNLLRTIEFHTQVNMIRQHVIPSTVTYKKDLTTVAASTKHLGIDNTVEETLLKKLATHMVDLYNNTEKLDEALKALGSDEEANSKKIATELFPLSEKIANSSNHIEELVPDTLWTLPKYIDMLFLK